MSLLLTFRALRTRIPPTPCGVAATDRISLGVIVGNRSHGSSYTPPAVGSSKTIRLSSRALSKSSVCLAVGGTLQAFRNLRDPNSRLVSRALSTNHQKEDAKSSGANGRAGKVPLTKALLNRLTPHENIYTIPNFLTVSRLLAAPFVGYFIATSQHTLALSLFAYAGITDLIDGYIARRYSMQTVVGTVIDPMADKALMTISVIALAVRSGIPWWLASIILLRDVGLGVAAIYYRWISLPPPKTMSRYWDFSLPSAEVHPTGISKFNTFLQLLLVGAGVALPVVPAAILHDWGLDAGFQAFQYVVATTTIWSGASYIYSKDAVKILTQEEIEERLAKKDQKNPDGGS